MVVTTTTARKPRTESHRRSGSGTILHRLSDVTRDDKEALEAELARVLEASPHDALGVEVDASAESIHESLVEATTRLEALIANAVPDIASLANALISALDQAYDALSE